MQWVVLVCITAVTARFPPDKTAPWRLVHIEQGPLKGYKSPDGDFFIFYGVPYATAPTGEDKFKAPLPPPNWTKPFEAVHEGIACPQKDDMNIIPKNYTIKEDCLVATIYVPNNFKRNIPVVVYVHGGAYLYAFGDHIQPKHIVKTKKIILVTFNYRLGAHGFLCLGTKDVPGNAGMKDQIALLRWVQRNIAEFGGNPKDVTLAGYSAGSSAVDLLMLSKMSRGLFHKVIPESGTSLATYTVQSDPLKNAKHFATMLNFSKVYDLEALEKFYKTASLDLLNYIKITDTPDSSLIFCPCVERDVGVERFLEKSPFDILASGDYPKLPLLYGFTTMEGLLKDEIFDTWKDQMNKKFSDFLPGDLIFKTDEQKEEIAKKIRKFYFGYKPVSKETVLGYIDYFTDILVTNSMLRVLNMHLEAGHDKIYFYEYVHVDKDSMIVPYTNIRGAEHCAQSWAVLDGKDLKHTNENSVCNDLMEMKNITRELWLNFMVTGKPVPEASPFPTWPTTGVNGVPHMALDNKLELRDYFERQLLERYQIWDEIYKKYYRNPIAATASNQLRSGVAINLLISIIYIFRIA